MKEVPPPNISCTLTFPLHEFSCAGVGMFLWGYIVCMISFLFFSFNFPLLEYFQFELSQPTPPPQLFLWSVLKGKNTTATPNQA